MTPLAGTSVPVADIRQTISEIVRAVLGREDVAPSVDVFDQGATSLALIRIVTQINGTYDVTVDVAELEEASVDTLSVLVAAQISNQNDSL
jgi:acyl carrier protein